ncbi:TonB-dependent siderophore receptor [Erythrobacter sp.]|uniref:TonB-dependent receptor plug domain-containing protein n=1 Tax=Erythrobacter sp. TaxID=1042 RepID=UPI001B056926|nr:TonB-dependent receptor [Erythrobacter sp.]MBO6527959.1 TonB-dependent receptor [Erythrobacter sp.]MBO6528648.1 TonB-dependent receptor [Erythrobacter sp.]
MSFKLFATAALAPISVCEQAPDTAKGDATILVEGARIGSSITTIGSAKDPDIAIPATTLELLETLPDLRAVSTGGAGGTSFVSIRGAEPNFAQVLIDGVRVSNPSNSQGGGFDFAQLDPALIQSVAITPASRSAVHGSDALSGVISLRLLDPSEDRVSDGGMAFADSDEGYSLLGRLGLGWEDGGVLLAGSLADTGELTEGSTIERSQALGRLVQSINGWKLSAFMMYGETERDGFPESSGGPQLAVNRALEVRDTRFLTAGAAVSGSQSMSIRPAIRVGYYGDNVVIDAPAIFPGVFDGVPALTSDTDFERIEIAGDVRFRITDQFDLVAGSGILSEEADSTGTIDFGFLVPTAFAISRDQTSLFSEAEWRPLDGLALSVAGRRDWFDDNAETTLHGSIEYTPGASGLTLFAGYSEGVRQPSLFALAFPLTANPDLLPERSVSWEGGLQWADGGTQLRFNLFHNDYTDLIDFDPVLFTTVNRAQTTIQGLSFSGRGPIGPSIDWNGSVTVLDIDSEAPLRGRPDCFGFARLIWRPADHFRLGASATFNSDLLETSIPTGVIEIDGRVAFDLFADWQAREGLTLSLTVRNALSEDWQEAVGFPSRDRIVRIRAGFVL